MPDVFGPIRDGEDAEQPAIAYLKRWLPLYVAEVERQKGDDIGSHPQPRTWTVKNEFTTFPEEQLPIVLVISTGTAGPPRHDGRGVWRAPFGLGIVVVASGKNWDNSRHNAGIYNKAIRAALLQKQSLETDFIKSTEWQGEAYDRLDEDRKRTLHAVRSAYVVWMYNVVSSAAGPGMFLPDPPADPVETVLNIALPKIKTRSVSVERSNP